MDVFPYRILLFTLIFNTLNAQEPKSNLIKDSIYAPTLSAYKTIRILLPASYEQNETAYPVIYMHDGQNLFDTATSYAGEWEVDETMSEFPEPYIVVGIDHGNDKRIDELTPFVHPEYGGGRGADYTDFMINTLKPHIDQHYRTLSDREHTLIAGSSLGGLISHYALFTYPETFGSAILFSPSYWFSEKIFKLTQKGIPGDKPVIYLATGALEPGATVPNHRKMISHLQQLEFSEQNLKHVIREEAGHNESFWRAEFPKALEWLREKQKEKP